MSWLPSFSPDEVAVIVDDEAHRIVLRGEIPSPTRVPTGCRFRSRCWKAQSVCAESEPQLRQLRDGHWAAYHFAA
jgi:oligopeptide/dipeptide ABC transporter ATP-binding protein